MRHLKIILLTLLFSSLALAKQWQVLEEETYKISYPKDFTLNTSGMMGTKFFLNSKKESETDKFIENINLVIQDVRGQNMDLDKFATITKNQIKALVMDAKIHSSNILTHKGKSYQRLVYSGKLGKLPPLKWVQYFYLHKGDAYILTLTLELGKKSRYERLGEEVMKNFELK